MGLDTRNRPQCYDDVLGQDTLKQICRHLVASGAGCHQSYIFAGPYGTGKTTFARILARALLCRSPQRGDPCDQCDSCRRMLDVAGSVDFVEVDAATRSGKADVLRILEDLAYDEGMGRRRIYLFDESHQLSSDALDAMLIPMEEEREGSGGDKRLVCIFCTTEADKMRPTILSRCAPLFRVRPVSPEHLAAYLAKVCDREKIAYESEALLLVARATDCHVRDALKAVEAAASMGGVTVQALTSYLGLDALDTYVQVVEAFGDPARVASLVRPLLEQHAPNLVYQKLADLCLAAFLKVSGAPPGGTWSPASLDRLAPMGPLLLTLAERLSSRPGRPNLATLVCDLAAPFPAAPSSPAVLAVPPPTEKSAAPRFIADEKGGVYLAPSSAPPAVARALTPAAFAREVRRRLEVLVRGAASS